MNTYVDRYRDMGGDLTPSVGGSRLRPRPLRKVPKIKNVPNDDLGRHLLTLFMLHDDVKSRFASPSESLNGVGNRLSDMNEGTKRHLLAKVERFLGVPRSEHE